MYSASLAISKVVDIKIDIMLLTLTTTSAEITKYFPINIPALAANAQLLVTVPRLSKHIANLL